MSKETTIIVITIIILIVYIWWDELIELLWLTLYYVIFPAIGIYLIKGFSDYRKKVKEQNEVELKRVLDEKNKQEELERKRILEEKREQEELERKRILEEKRKKEELERIDLRDSDCQDEPYTYEVKGIHPNEQFAIRYGIANNSDKIKLRKLKKLQKDYYEVELTDYRDRHARVVIEKGTEYVKTFLPLDDEWFKKHVDLELTLKGNGSFTLKELATFHVQKIINS
jgi:hypothetical protein